MIGKSVLIRTYSAGVHFGILAKHEGREVELRDARRIWSWRGANTLNEIALHGVAKDGSRVSEQVARVILTEVIEIIPLTQEAIDSLGAAGWGA